MTGKQPRSEDNDAFDGGTSPLKSDLQSAKDFLVDITRRWPEVCEGAQLEVTGILKVDEKTKQVRPALYPPTEQGIAAALNRAAALNNQGFNIYFAPNPVAPHVRLNPGKRPKDIDIAGAVYAFADGDDDVASYALLEETLSTLVVRTGSVPGPRVHAYWELIEPIKFNGWAVSNLKRNTRPLDFIIEDFLGGLKAEAGARPCVEAMGDFFEITA